MSAKVLHGKCENILPTLPDCSVDSIVTDPPYELGFMGKGWDSSGIAYSVDMWAECLRVLKPGGHLLAFGGTRTYHRLAVAIEDAGFEIRDSIAWMYGSGFPKSLDVSRAIETQILHGGSSQKQLRMRDMGADYAPHPLSGTEGFGDGNLRKGADGNTQGKKAPVATPDAERWEGWGTALKPAFEPIVVARKPIQGTVAANVLAWGTGALNIDATRVNVGAYVPGGGNGEGRSGGIMGKIVVDARPRAEAHAAGRWPANVTLDPEAAAELDRQSGESVSSTGVRDPNGTMGYHGGASGLPGVVSGHSDSGGASRFFPVFRYEAKAPTSERPKVNGIAHPTVKPLKLIRWLVRLVTPPGGTVLDPFAGSGTTGEACILEGFNAILIEREADHLPLIHHRLTRANDALGLFGEETA